MDKLTITEKRGTNYVLYELNGTFSSYTVGDFQTSVLENIKTTNVVFDLSQVISIDSTGIGVIFAGFNDGLKTGYKLYLMNMSFSVTNSVKETGFLEAFNIIQSVTEVV